jgi:hypothetical protein
MHVENRTADEFILRNGHQAFERSLHGEKVYRLAHVIGTNMWNEAYQWSRLIRAGAGNKRRGKGEGMAAVGGVTAEKLAASKKRFSCKRKNAQITIYVN